VFRPFNTSIVDDSDVKHNRFEGVLRQLSRPPRVVEFDGFC
jgi:hypothetical protein